MLPDLLIEKIRNIIRYFKHSCRTLSIQDKIRCVAFIIKLFL